MNQKQLEVAMRRMWNDSSLEADRKAYLMQHIMASRHASLIFCFSALPCPLQQSQATHGLQALCWCCSSMEAPLPAHILDSPGAEAGLTPLLALRFCAVRLLLLIVRHASDSWSSWIVRQRCPSRCC